MKWTICDSFIAVQSIEKDRTCSLRGMWTWCQLNVHLHILVHPFCGLETDNPIHNYMWKTSCSDTQNVETQRSSLYNTNSLVKNTDDLSLFCSLVVVIIHTVETYYSLKKEGDNSWMKGERTLNRGGRQRKSFNRNDNPITVAMLQCWTVGVNVTLPKAHQKPIEFMSNEKESMACCCHVWESTLLQQIVQRDTTTLIMQADWTSLLSCVSCVLEDSMQS